MFLFPISFTICLLLNDNLDFVFLVPELHELRVILMSSFVTPRRIPSHSQNISKTISNIPVHTGVQELKNIAYLTLLPPFLIWLKDVILAIKDLCLHFKDWVELIPLGHGYDLSQVLPTEREIKRHTI